MVCKRRSLKPNCLPNVLIKTPLRSSLEEKLVVKLIFGAPDFPRLVVIMTTPFAAREPYWAAAAAPFITLRLSMSFGLISAKRFVPSVALGACPPNVSANCETDDVSLLTITPSITYKGSELPWMDFTPRKRTVIPPAGSPEFWVICAPGTFPCKALTKLGVPVFSRLSALIVVMAFPSCRRSARMVEPVTMTSSKFIWSSRSDTFTTD